MIPYTAAQFLAIFRAEVGDRQEGINSSDPDSENLWKDEEIYGYMYEAECMVARRTGYLQHVFTLPVLAGSATVSLPSWVHDINHIRLLTVNRELCEMNLNESVIHEDDYGIFSNSSALFDQTGEPSRYMRDYDTQGKKLRLWPTPITNDTLSISAKTLPRRPIMVDGAGGEVMSFTDPYDTRLMLHWMKHLAYNKQDADAFDPQASEKFRALFENDVLIRDGELRRVRRRPGLVVYGGL